MGRDRIFDAASKLSRTWARKFEEFKVNTIPRADPPKMQHESEHWTAAGNKELAEDPVLGEAFRVCCLIFSTTDCNLLCAVVAAVDFDPDTIPLAMRLATSLENCDLHRPYGGY